MTSRRITRERARLEDMNARGYMVCREEFDQQTTDWLLSTLSKVNVGRIIFNSERNDHRRIQSCNLATRCSIPVEAALARLQQQALLRFPRLAPNDAVVLRSEPGCEEQQAHADYDLGDPKLAAVAEQDEELLPWGMLVALQPSKLVIWPYSSRQVLLAFDVPDEKRQYRDCRKEELQLAPGDAVYFRADTIHAGACYETGDNLRVHVYLDSPVVKRQPNRTWIVRDAAPAFRAHLADNF